MKMNLIKKMNRFTELLTAAAFAELGHFESARQIVGDDGHKDGNWNRMHAAIGFAESGEFGTAREIMTESERHSIYPDDCQYGDNDLCYIQT